MIYQRKSEPHALCMYHHFTAFPVWFNRLFKSDELNSFWNLKEQVSCTGLWIVLLALKFYQVLLYLLFLLLLSCGFYCLHNDICFVGFSFWICSSSWIIFVSPKSSSFNIYLCYLCLHHPIVIMCSFYPLIFLNFSFCYSPLGSFVAFILSLYFFAVCSLSLFSFSLMHIQFIAEILFPEIIEYDTKVLLLTKTLLIALPRGKKKKEKYKNKNKKRKKKRKHVQQDQDWSCWETKWRSQILL